MAQLVIGLDLGHESIKRVRLRGSFRNIEVIDYTSVPVPQDERPFEQRAAAAVAQLELKPGDTDLLATALPGDQVSIRLLTLPFADPKKIASTIGFELESQIPFSLDQVVYDYVPQEKTPDGGRRLLVAMCQVEHLTRWLTALKEASVDPRLVGADSLSYTSLLDLLPPLDPQQSVAFLDIGHRLTSLCLVGPGGVELSRTLSGGGWDVTCQLSETFKINTEEARAGKHRGVLVASKDTTLDTPDQTKVSEAIRKSLAPLLREIRQTLGSHRTMSSRSLTKVWLCGGGSSIANLDHFLAEDLQVPVERLMPQQLKLTGAEKLGHEDSSQWVKALSLALHAHQGGRSNWLNLRRGTYAFKGDFEFLRGRIKQVAIALMVLLVLAVGQAVIRYVSLSKTERSLTDRLKEVTQTILGKSYDVPEKAIAVIKERIAPGADPLPRITAVDALRELHSQVPTDMKLRLTAIDIKPKRISLTGFTDSFESVEKLKAALEKYKCFHEIQTGNTQKTKDESEIKFDLSITLGC